MLSEPVIIDLDKPRKLRLNLNAMIKFEETTGKDLLKGFDPENMSLKDVRALVWCSMLNEDKSLTLEQVGDLIDLNNMQAVIESVTKTATNAFPEQKGESSPNPPNL